LGGPNRSLIKPPNICFRARGTIVYKMKIEVVVLIIVNLLLRDILQGSLSKQTSGEHLVDLVESPIKHSVEQTQSTT